MYESYYLHIFVSLLLIAAATALAVKWIRVPYSIALVIVGLFIGLCHLLPRVELDPAIMLLVFLPGLLFEASWNLDLKRLKYDWLPIGLLATIGVLISMSVTALIMQQFGGFALVPALLFGAILSATDPISVIALFKKIGVDRRLTVLVDGESLFNDGTAVVLFRIILGAALGGALANPLAVGTSLIVVSVGGVLVGLASGVIASKITKLFDDHLMEITLTTILAYGSYLVAEQLNVSPVLAVVVAGIVMGNYGSRTSMSPGTRLAVNAFWQYIAFAMNSIVFLLIGLQLKYELLVKYAAQIGVGILAIVIARCILVYALVNVVGIKRRWRMPFKWQHILVWGGLRGALSMAMALSLPASIADREAIIVTVFGVVLFTLLVPGLTVEPLIKLLKMDASDFTLKQYRALKGELISINAALDHLKILHKSRQISDKTYDRLKGELDADALRVSRSIDDLHLSNVAIQQLELSEVGLELVQVRKDKILFLTREGRISDDDADELGAKLDERMQQLSEQDMLAVESATVVELHGTAAVAQEIERSVENDAEKSVEL